MVLLPQSRLALFRSDDAGGANDVAPTPDLGSDVDFQLVDRGNQRFMG
jgi:hypothetical protein